MSQKLKFVFEIILLVFILVFIFYSGAFLGLGFFMLCNDAHGLFPDLIAELVSIAAFLSLFTIVPIYSISRYFFLYFFLKILEHKGSDKSKEIIKRLKNNYKIQIIILLIAVCFDVFFILIHQNQINFAAFILLMFVFSTFIPCLVTFIMWKLESIFTNKSKRCTD